MAKIDANKERGSENLRRVVGDVITLRVATESSGLKKKELREIAEQVEALTRVLQGSADYAELRRFFQRLS